MKVKWLVWLFVWLILSGCVTPAGTPPPALSPTSVATQTPTPTLLPPPVIAFTASPTEPIIVMTRPVATPTPFTPPDLRYLQAAIDSLLTEFDGDGLSSYVVIDLQNSQEISHNPDLAIAGMSLLKIPILLEAYRAFDAPPDLYQTRLLTETASLSSNYSSNLLLEQIAGRPDAFAGSQIVTQSLHRLGLYNTFLAVPYDQDARPDYLSTYLTPANQSSSPTTYPDPFRQTTTHDLARLLHLIYDCATTGQGLLLESYPQQLSQAECAAVFEMMKLNHIGELIEAGLPPGVPIAHKHGWISDTHGDAAIIFSPGRDYILTIALYHQDWLVWQTSSPLMAAISALAYAHFNNPAAYRPETLATPLPPLPTSSPTPNLPQAIVTNTNGLGLTLRATPAGAELLVLPEGSLVYLLAGPAISQNNLIWRHIRTPAGVEGWVGESYLLNQP